jgi:hypothetical protein
MYTDARIGAAFEGMMRGIEPPALLLAGIYQKLSQPPSAHQHTSLYSRYAIAAAAAVAVCVFTVPRAAPGFVQGLEARVAAVLGWEPPPAPPRSLLNALTPQAGSLAAAQSRVPFTIVSPTGLPSDVVSMQISTAPSGVYSKATATWSKGSQAVTFTYRRGDGRSFSVLADEFDPQMGPPSKYMFEDQGTAADGREVLVKREKFTWRNGNQVMTAITSDGLSAPEIEAIRVAMGGVTIPSAKNATQLHSGRKVKMYVGP